MKTADEINKEIMATTLEIQNNFPELLKYIMEMPVTIPNEANPEITVENLKEYSESLKAFVTQYQKNKKLTGI